MIGAEEAWEHVLRHAAPLNAEPRPLCSALHFVLAADVRADRDIPASDRAAMDGYAIRAADAETGSPIFRVTGEVPAGSAAEPTLAPGECVRIFTGANVPSSADTVVMLERTEAVSGRGAVEEIRLLEPVVPGQHIFRRGENAAVGETVVPAGTPLGAAQIGICAAVGCHRPTVHRRPTVGILVTGAELKNMTDDVLKHEVRDSNGPMLIAALGQHHFPCGSVRPVSDDADAMTEALEASLGENDVVLITGGVSVGKYDLVPDAVRGVGAEIVYHGLRIKPGKPQLFAVSHSGRCIFGLPGNPLSAMIGLQEFALPALRRMAGTQADRCRPLLRIPVTADVSPDGKRQRHILARLVRREAELHAEPVPAVGSADLVAAGKADGTILVEPGRQEIAPFESVDFRPWGVSL